MRGVAKHFLTMKAGALRSRARRLIALTPNEVGLRPGDMPYAPSAAHFAAAGRRLSAIDREIRRRLKELAHLPQRQRDEDRLVAIAMVEREVDRARRAFGLFFEVFAQRGTAFAPSLAAHDAIARDCYAAIRAAAPRIFRGPLLAPITYLEHGYSPATMRRGVTLSRLLGERNPFPLIRIPYDRDQPWQAVFLHEVAHNIQADLGLWVENREAIIARLVTDRLPPKVVSIFGRWQKEIFADMAAVLLGGPAVAWGMAEFLAHPSDKVMTYRPGGPHPTGYLRILLLAEQLRQLGFTADAERLAATWRTLYAPQRGHRIPAELLRFADKTLPAVVDEVVFQSRRNLAERALVRVIPFTPADQARIVHGGRVLVEGRVPADLPPRYLVSACRYALAHGACAHRLNQLVTDHLCHPATAHADQGPPAARRIPTRLAA
jgi:hypothetical protein